MKKLEINGGCVNGANRYHFILPPVAKGYGNAQIDDYAGSKRADYPWKQGVEMSVQARFSHAEGELRGTAGFGFWNAPFGDPTVPYPALPQAVWFFYGSPETNLPLAPLNEQGEARSGNGWFAGTLDATTGRALAISPLAPLTVLGNRWRPFRQRVWPGVQKRLGMSYQQLAVDMTAWHHYRLRWTAAGCAFWVDEQLVLETAQTPRGPLGFVAWLDNQYMCVTPTGRFGWGVLPTAEEQWLETADLRLERG